MNLWNIQYSSIQKYSIVHLQCSFIYNGIWFLQKPQYDSKQKREQGMYFRIGVGKQKYGKNKPFPNNPFAITNTHQFNNSKLSVLYCNYFLCTLNVLYIALYFWVTPYVLFSWLKINLWIYFHFTQMYGWQLRSWLLKLRILLTFIPIGCLLRLTWVSDSVSTGCFTLCRADKVKHV